ncbi:MAG: peptide-binding protein [Aureliella sp.]
MTSRLNSDTASQFPLAIPTRSKTPAARLVLRGRDGLVLKQWLIKTTKCTIGSDPECNLRCDLPGIAAYHVLIVVGSRQTFLRALAPRLTRDGVAVNELLLTGETSAFEIAGHQFELSRQDAAGQLAAPSTPQARMRFALSSPLETRPKNSDKSDTAAKVIADGEHNDLLPAGSDTATPRWVARIVRDAVAPLETQLREVIEPIEALKAEVRRERRRRQAEEEKRDLENRVPQTPQIDEESVKSVVKEQVEALTARQAGAIDVITERISDVNHQLSSIERIVAAERESQPVEAESVVAEEIEAQSQSIQKLQEGFVAVASALNELQASQNAKAESEGEWKQEVQGKLDALQNAVENMRGQSAQVAELSDEEREQLTSELAKSQSAFDIALPAADDYSSIEVAAQAIAQEWDPTELTSVVDSDKVTISPTSVPFASLNEPEPNLDSPESTEPPSVQDTHDSDELAGDVWDQEAEIESIETYDPQGSAELESQSADGGEFESLDLESQQSLSDDELDEFPTHASESRSDADNWVPGKGTYQLESTTESESDEFATLQSAVGTPWDESGLIATEEGTADPFEELVAPEPQQTQAVEPESWDLPADEPANDSGHAGFSTDDGTIGSIEEETLEASAQFDDENLVVDEQIAAAEDTSGSAQIDEEQASLPSWWDEAGGDVAASESNEHAGNEPASPLPAFNDPEFATAAEFVQEQAALAEPTPSDDVAADSSSGSTADADHRDEDASERIVPNAFEPESPTAQNPQQEVAQQVESLEPSPNEEEFPTLDQPVMQETAGSAKDTSTSALELIEELSVATEAANDDSPVDSASVSDDSLFAGLSGDNLAPASEHVELESPEADEAPIEAPVALETDNAARSLADDSFPTVQTMADREASSIFALSSVQQIAAPDKHLLDDQTEDAPVEQTDATDVADEIEASAPETATSTAEAPAQADAEETQGEEESVEDYMRRLLARMRGEPDAEENANAEPNNPDLAISAPSKMIQDAQAGVEAEQVPLAIEHESGTSTSGFPGMTRDETAEDDTGLTPQQMKLLQEKEDESRGKANRNAAPEMSGQLEAMRELANSTARTAIGKSNRRRVLSSLIMKATISAVGMTVAVALIAINGLSLNIGLIATGAAILVAAIWGWDAITTLRHFKEVPADSKESEED